MSFLSKYGLRLVLLFTMILIIGSISTITALTISLDNNISTIEEATLEYESFDQSVIQLIRSTSSDVDKIVRDELVQNVDVVVGGEGEEIENNASSIVAKVSTIIALLEEREENNYEIEGLEYGVLNSSIAFTNIPDFSEIITTGSESSSSAIIPALDRLNGTTGTSLSSVLTNLDDIRATFELNLGQLTTDLNTFNSKVAEMSDLLDTLAAKSEDLTNKTDSSAALTALYEVSDAFGAFNRIYTNFVVRFQADPINFDASPNYELIASRNNTLKAAIQGFRDVVEETQFLEILSFQNELDNSLHPLIVFSLGNIEDLQESYQDILSEQEIIINDIRQDTLNALNATLGIVTIESNLFSDSVEELNSDMEQGRQTITSNVFIALNVFVFISLGYVMYILTRGIARITTKNEMFAQGNLNIRIRESYPNNEMGRLEQSLDNSIREMRAIITSVTQTSETLAGISEELAAGAEEASASINEVSSTVREFSAGSSEQNIMLNRVRNELLTHMDIIESTANQIDETANFVLTVAKRTNILGLNASIEAAKAGRFGLGFDVVAEEVRSLSEETSNSAERIAKSIEEIEFNIRRTVEDILAEVNIIREVAENTAAGSEEASASTSEQVGMLNEISQTSSQLSELSQTLNSLLHRFKL